MLCLPLLFVSCGTQNEEVKTASGATQNVVQKPWEIAYTAYDKQAFYEKRGKEPVVIFFYSSQNAGAILLDEALTKSGNALSGKLTVYKADFDRELELRKEFNVALPDTVVVLDAKGQVQAVSSGVVSFVQLQDLFNVVLKG